MDATEESALASGASVDELVPGSVEQILGLADELSGLGDGLLDAATALSRVEVTGWYGAASTAAHARLGEEPSRWSGASGAFTTAGEALRRYAAALAPARAMAEQAVDAYRRYLDLVRVLEVATAGVVPSTDGNTAVPGSGQLATSGPDRAQLGHRAAVLVAADRSDTNPAAVAALGPMGADLSGLAHSADALRREAVSLLSDARAQVTAAGDAAAASVQAAMADAPDSRTFWQGTIRKPGVEDASHSTLDIAGFIPGWIGIGATLVNVGWYALEGDRENAGYAAMGVVPGPAGKLGKALDTVRGIRSAEETCEIADRIAEGHAWQKHVIAKREFPGISTPQQFQDLVRDVMLHGESRSSSLFPGKEYFFKDGVFVAYNPKDPDFGSAFRPKQGYDYFLGQR